MRTAPILVCLVLAAPGCSGAEEPTPDATELHYTEVQPDHPVSAVVDEKIRAALAIMNDTAAASPSDHRGRLAAETLERVQAGAARIDTLEDAGAEDLYHMCRDFMLPDCATPLADPGTFMPDASVVSFLFESLYGYTWGDRIYLTIDESTDPGVLAATLVHEVDHVLNRSECSYYVDIESQAVDDVKAFLEEYRAFGAEYVFQHADSASTPGAAHDYAAMAVAAYGFAADITDIVGNDPPESVVVSLLADEDRYGWLFPSPPHWPADVSSCPAP